MREEFGRLEEVASDMSCGDEVDVPYRIALVGTGRIVPLDPEELDELSKLVETAGAVAVGERSGLLP